MEGLIIEMFVKPLNRERFEQKEEAEIISLHQRNCSHELEIDEEIDQHNCVKCGKLFTSHEALLYILHNRMQQLKISSYNLRNEMHFLTEKIDSLKSDIEFLKKEKRATVKFNKS
jgi:tRNA U54 and U55 pseudouridine synthase Pus10